MRIKWELWILNEIFFISGYRSERSRHDISQFTFISFFLNAVSRERFLLAMLSA
jgi:hypothetical protein